MRRACARRWRLDGAFHRQEKIASGEAPAEPQNLDFPGVTARREPRPPGLKPGDRNGRARDLANNERTMMLTTIKTWWIRFRFRQILLELVVSVCLACLVWLYTHNRARNSIDRVAVPVQVQLAAHQRDQFALELSEQRTVLASFSGPHSRIREVRRNLQRGLLKATLTLTIPEEKKVEAMVSEMLHVDEDAFNVPAGVKVEIAQESLPITVHRLTERTLPVRLEFTGEARVSQIK